MLLVSGDLNINSTSVSSALFDGESWHPYLISTSNSGKGGVIAQLFYSVANFQLSPGRTFSFSVSILFNSNRLLTLLLLYRFLGCWNRYSNIDSDSFRSSLRTSPDRTPSRFISST